MNSIDEIITKIDTKKEVLDTLPKNNKKNIKIYIEELEKVIKEYKEYQEIILNEIEKRYNKANDIKENKDLKNATEEVKNSEGILYLLNEIDTSYEKMDLDRAMHNLNYYYKKNLEVVNESILFCIKKFREVGIHLKPQDFCYSKYVQEYIGTFFSEMEDGNINSKRIKNKFEEIYWKCPDIITHIELNIRYLYLKNEKNIDKYYQKQISTLTKKFTSQEMIKRYKEAKRNLVEKQNNDKYTIIKGILDGELNIKDYSKKSLDTIYENFIPSDILKGADSNKYNEIDSTMGKLYNSIYEYQNYLKYKFIIDDVKKIYEEKDKYKKAYAETKKQITSKEKKVLALNKKINGNGMFKKANDSFTNEQNTLILEIKQLYRELDQNKVYDKIATTLNDNSNISEALYLASSFYSYLFDCIKDNDKEIPEEDINQMIDELREFVKWPYETIINNVEIKENKDILIIIKDRYQLLNIKIEKEDLDVDNLDNLMKNLKIIEYGHNIRKNEIDIEELNYVCEFKKILNK